MSLRRRPARRRGGAALLLSVLLIVALTACAGGTDHQPARPHGWQLQHRVDVPPGWQVSQRNVGPVDDSTWVSGPDSAGCGVSSSSERPPLHLWPRWPQLARVHGIRAFYGNRDPDFGPYPRMVLWRQAGRWFDVSCDLDRAGILRMAERVHPGLDTLQVPFRLSAVPAGLTMSQLISSSEDRKQVVAAQFAMAGSPEPMTMQISNVVDDSWFEQGEAERASFGGHAAEIRPATQTICFATRSDPICILGPSSEAALDWSAESRVLAFRTAELLTPIADSADTSQWVDADLAFPR